MVAITNNFRQSSVNPEAGHCPITEPFVWKVTENFPTLQFTLEGHAKGTLQFYKECFQQSLNRNMSKITSEDRNSERQLNRSLH